jgi:hypothetical protein
MTILFGAAMKQRTPGRFSICFVSKDPEEVA